MATAQELKAAGFSDEEISAEIAAESAKLSRAGFTAKEISEYLGVQPAIPKQPKVVDGIGEAFKAGWQRSVPGLIERGQLPDLVIDNDKNGFWERNVALMSQAFNEVPEMALGGLVAYFASRNRIAGAAGSGFLPGNLRTAYTQAIQDGKINSSTGFLEGLKIAMPYMAGKEALKVGAIEGASAAAVAGVSIGTTKLVAPRLQNLVEKGIISQRTATVGTVAAVAAAEYPTAVMIGPALQGKLPEQHEWWDGAFQIVAPKIGMTVGPAAVNAAKSVPEVSRRLMETWRRTGKTPAEIVADADANPSIRADLVKGTPAEQALRQEAKKQGVDVQEIDPATLDLSIFDTPETAATKPADAGGWKPPVDPTEPLAVQAGKDAARAAVADAYAKGRIPEQAAYRGLYVDELMKIAEKGELPLRTNMEGESVIAATPVAAGKLDGAAYGAGAGYIVPRERTTPSGLAGEVHVDPKTNPRELLYVIDGKTMTFDEMKAQVLGPTGKRQKTAEEVAQAAADKQWMDDFFAGKIVPRAYREQASRMAAEEAFPDYQTKAQRLIENPMGEIPEAKEKGYINFKYVEGPDDVKALFARMSEISKAEIESQRNGTQTWAQTEAKALQQLRDMYGKDVDRILAGRKPGDAVSTVEMDVRARMNIQAALDVREALDAWKKATPEDKAARLADLVEKTGKSSMVYSELIGARAEAARALQYSQKMSEVIRQNADVAKIVELYGKNPEVLANMLDSAKTPEALAALTAKAMRPTLWQKFIEYYRASLMSGFLTVGYNIAGNAAFLAQRNFLVEPGAALVGLISRSPDRVTMTEVVARTYGSLYMAPMSMIRSMGEAYKADGFKGAGLRAWEAGQEVSPAPVINTGAVGKFTKAVYGTNSMLDAMFRELTTQGELYSLATKEAIKNGHEVGTLDFFREVKAMVENPTDAMLQAADTAATRSVFAAPMGKVGQAFNKFMEAAPPVRIVVPFQQTPANILKETFRNSPFAPLVDTWLADVKKGGAARDKAVAEMAVGSALFTAAYFMALDGRITGSLDPDPKKKAVEMASGKQPYSYKTDDGQYVPLVRIAPTVGTMIGMAADIAQLQSYMTPEEEHRVGKMAMLTFKNAVTNQTMLAGLTNGLKAMEEENSFFRFVNSTAGGMVPASGMLGQIASVKDPYAREIYNTLDAIRYKIPGVRETLEPKIDAWGVEVAEAERPLFIAPVKITKESDDKVRTEAARLGVSSSKPPKNVDVGINMGRIGLVELTPEQRTAYAKAAGELAYQIVAPAVNSPLWDKTPDLIQRQIMQDALEAGRSYATSTVFTPQQLQQELLTRGEELRKRLQPK